VPVPGVPRARPPQERERARAGPAPEKVGGAAAAAVARERAAQGGVRERAPPHGGVADVVGVQLARRRLGRRLVRVGVTRLAGGGCGEVRLEAQLQARALPLHRVHG